MPNIVAVAVCLIGLAGTAFAQEGTSPSPRFLDVRDPIDLPRLSEAFQDPARPDAGSLTITGEFLYLMPTTDDTTYVIKAPVTQAFPSGPREDNEFGFHSGFRAGIGYELSDRRGLRLNYTMLSAKESESAIGDFLWATVGRADFTSFFENYTGTASSVLHLGYRRVDALFTKTWDLPGLQLSLLAGVEYTALNLRQDYDYVSGAAVGSVRERSRTWGVGPELGLAVDFALLQGTAESPGTLAVNVVFATSLLSAQSASRQTNQINAATILNVDDDPASRLLTALHGQIGLSYNPVIAGLQTKFAIGYEFNSYLRGLTRISHPDDVADGEAQTQFFNFDLQGMYLSVGVSF
jgi:major outer membrane protein